MCIIDDLTQTGNVHVFLRLAILAKRHIADLPCDCSECVRLKSLKPMMTSLPPPADTVHVGRPLSSEHETLLFTSVLFLCRGSTLDSRSHSDFSIMTTSFQFEVWSFNVLTCAFLRIRLDGACGPRQSTSNHSNMPKRLPCFCKLNVVVCTFLSMIGTGTPCAHFSSVTPVSDRACSPNPLPSMRRSVMKQLFGCLCAGRVIRVILVDALNGTDTPMSNL
mmetsp:Transcript_11430/g.18803  ORF Transcript_11430/g.18803 Transcript_11430/m.18803 type:complete len:220 (-) Transcript_11430:2048-2707(-)